MPRIELSEDSSYKTIFASRGTIKDGSYFTHAFLGHYFEYLVDVAP